MTARLRVGILNDMSDGPPGPTDIKPWLRVAVEELRATGRIDHEVEYLDAYGLGLPAGTAAAVERAFATLVEQQVLLIVGPMIGDNALIAAPLSEASRVPTLNWAGAERARNQYMFHLQIGSHEDESIVIARHLAALGRRRVAVIYDQSPIGCRHLEFLRDEAVLLGIGIVAAEAVDPLAETVLPAVDALIAAQPQALVYLGLGLAGRHVARAVEARAWQGPRIMNTAGMRGYVPDYGRDIDGWSYVDMHADDNRTLAALRRRLNIPAAQSLSAAKGYDLGRLVAEGLARAPDFSREGLRLGLERIKYLAAATGHEGTLLGFGVWDRGALHGRYLVMRQWRDGVSHAVGTTD